MQMNRIVTPHFPTHEDIERGIAQGRLERSRAVGAMTQSLVNFVIGRKVKRHAGCGRIAPLAG